MTYYREIFLKLRVWTFPVAALAVAALVGAHGNALADDGKDWVNGFPNAENSDYMPRTRLDGCDRRYGAPAELGVDAADAGKSIDAATGDIKLSRVWGVEKNLTIKPTGDDAILDIVYPKGSYTPGADDAPRGGAGFVAEFGTGDGLARACLTYRVRFQDDFYFKKGGKLPGLYGGNGPTGGDKVTGKNGFTARLMWRSLGAGEAYAYIVNKPMDYGLSIGRGAWRFQPGKWHTIQQEVVLNDPSEANGKIRVWIDGRHVIDKDQLAFRTTDRVKIDGLMFQTFFGGGDPSWASPREQRIQFADFTIYSQLR